MKKQRGLVEKSIPEVKSLHLKKERHYKIKDTSKMHHFGEKNPFFGGHHSEKAKEKIKRKLKELYVKGIKMGFQKGNRLSVGNTRGKTWKVKDTSKCREAQNRPEVKKKKRERMINNPNKKFSGMTIELKMRAELEKRGFRKDVDYYCNVGLCNLANVDIYLPTYKIVIECDGCFYHNCLIHYLDYHKGAREADERKTKLLTYNGFNVYRFWEHEINSSVENCLNKIKVLNKK